MAKNIPELYRITIAKYSCESTLVYGEHTIPSREGSQQGDPVSSLEFCEAIQPVQDDLDSELDIGFIDDLSLSSDLSTLEKDVNSIIEAESVTGLRLNPSKCEIIMDDFSSVETMNVFKDFIRVPKDQMTLLGATISRGHALDKALQAKVDDLERAVTRLKLLHAHDALVLLKNSLSMPRLLYTLRTSDCRDHPLLDRKSTRLNSSHRL